MIQSFLKFSKYGSKYGSIVDIYPGWLRCIFVYRVCGQYVQYVYMTWCIVISRNLWNVIPDQSSMAFVSTQPLTNGTWLGIPCWILHCLWLFDISTWPPYLTLCNMDGKVTKSVSLFRCKDRVSLQCCAQPTTVQEIKNREYQALLYSTSGDTGQSRCGGARFQEMTRATRFWWILVVYSKKSWIGWLYFCNSVQIGVAKRLEVVQVGVDFSFCNWVLNALEQKYIGVAVSFDLTQPFWWQFALW